MNGEKLGRGKIAVIKLDELFNINRMNYMYYNLPSLLVQYILVYPKKV